LVEDEGIEFSRINLALLIKDIFISQNIYDFAEYTESINGILAFYNLAFQSEWKLGYNGCIDICTFYGGKV
jgi:hypothetical protein